VAERRRGPLAASAGWDAIGGGYCGGGSGSSARGEGEEEEVWAQVQGRGAGGRGVGAGAGEGHRRTQPLAAVAAVGQRTSVLMEVEGGDMRSKWKMRNEGYRRRRF
jgi:hypothetical protein